MVYQQLRIFAFVVISLVHLSAAAHFECSNVAGPIICHVTIGPHNSFIYSPDSQEPSCTEDQQYCAVVTGQPGQASWEIYVTNGDGQCWAGCPVRVGSTCDETFCWDTCEADAC